MIEMASTARRKFAYIWTRGLSPLSGEPLIVVTLPPPSIRKDASGFKSEAYFKATRQYSKDAEWVKSPQPFLYSGFKKYA